MTRNKGKQSKNDESSSTINDVYAIWLLIGGLTLAGDISDLMKNVTEINFIILFQILFLLIKDTIIGGIAAGIYKIVKSVVKFDVVLI